MSPNGDSMRRILLWSALAGFAACLIRPTLVSMTPDYGYADGCFDVVVQGHNLGTEAKAKVGSEPFLAFTAAENDPKLPEHAQDVGFKYFGTVPPSPSGEPGWFDVVLEVDGEELTLRDGIYYRSCPGSFVVDAITVPAEGVAGDPIAVVGCQLDDEVQVQFLDLTGVVISTAPLVSDCSTAQVHADIPGDLPAGDYTVQLVHDDGTVYAGDCYADSGDTGLTCVPLLLTVTGRRGAE